MTEAAAATSPGGGAISAAFHHVTRLDLLVGLPYYRQAHSAQGRALVWYGGAQTLSLARAGNGAGYVISTPPGIDYGVDCQQA
ncbi:MAG: hypothetical protein ACE5ID_06320 [Acidobacteriota bacterium]